MQEYRGYPLRLFPDDIQTMLKTSWDIQTKANICRQADQYIKNFLEKDMAPFKVGDKVKCIKPKSDVHPDYDVCGVGVYTVASVGEDWSGGYYVRLKGGPTFGLKHDRFELVKEGHPHAILMARYAEVAKDHPEPWGFFQRRSSQTGEWVPQHHNPVWHPNVEYREKPEEITASLWVAYLVHADAPSKLLSLTGSSEEAIRESVAMWARNSGYRVVKDAHEVTETYEVL